MKIIYPSNKEEKQINRGIHSDPDAQEWTDDMFRRATRGPQIAPTKKQVTVRFDPDIIDWFKDQGPGYQSRMNDALRHYMNKNESRIQ